MCFMGGAAFVPRPHTHTYLSHRTYLLPIRVYHRRRCCSLKTKQEDEVYAQYIGILLFVLHEDQLTNCDMPYSWLL